MTDYDRYVKALSRFVGGLARIDMRVESFVVAIRGLEKI